MEMKLPKNVDLQIFFNIYEFKHCNVLVVSFYFFSLDNNGQALYWNTFLEKICSNYVRSTTRRKIVSQTDLCNSIPHRRFWHCSWIEEASSELLFLKSTT